MATEPKILLFDPLGKSLPISILESMCIFYSFIFAYSKLQTF